MNESDNTISGPCLPWCFTHNRDTYIILGIIFGIILGIIFGRIHM